MKKIILFAIPLICVLLHFLTPDRILDGYLAVFDLIMILAAVFSALAYRSEQDHKWIGRLSWVVSISVLLVFLFFSGTTDVDCGMEGPGTNYWRLAAIFKVAVVFTKSRWDVLFLFPMVLFLVVLVAAVVLAIVLNVVKVKKGFK